MGSGAITIGVRGGPACGPDQVDAAVAALRAAVVPSRFEPDRLTTGRQLALVGRLEPVDLAAILPALRWLGRGRPPGTLPCDVAGLAEPDLGTIDALARLQVQARRLGCPLVLERVTGPVRDLIGLAGLGGHLPIADRRPR